jgi:aspartyl-tRNA(Asn)/glutamyl-tRNA(Gln) amidotransferase subunit B
VEAEMEVGDAKIKPAAIGELVELVESKRITSRNAQEAFGIMFETGGTPEAIADEQGWKPADAGEIESFCDEAIAANPGPADDVRKGKDAAVNRILGHVMKLSKGSADPGQTRVLLLKKLRG